MIFALEQYPRSRKIQKQVKVFRSKPNAEQSRKVIFIDDLAYDNVGANQKAAAPAGFVLEYRRNFIREVGEENLIWDHHAAV